MGRPDAYKSKNSRVKRLFRRLKSVLRRATDVRDQAIFGKRVFGKQAGHRLPITGSTRRDARGSFPDDYRTAEDRGTSPGGKYHSQMPSPTFSVGLILSGQIGRVSSIPRRHAFTAVTFKAFQPGDGFIGSTG